jgi:hypothetical protein
MEKTKIDSKTIELNTLSKHEQYNILHESIDHNLTSEQSAKLSKQEKDIFTKANEKLDKYYTKEAVALQCYLSLKNILIASGYNLDNILFIEPSAGSGVFLNQIEEYSVGFDIAPTKNEKNIIRKNDFLNSNLTDLLSNEEKVKYPIIIGNPPFGTKSKMAIDFINKGFEYSDIVAFIVPLQFRKYGTQTKINKYAKLIYDLTLQENAFEFMGKDYKVRCCFQVWIKNGYAYNYEDLRILIKPDVNHQDFEMYQYNRTEEAKKFFDFDWDFAVPRQGYNDYNFKGLKKEDCDMKKQWIFFKAKNKKVLENLMKLDFEKLSKKNTGIPGFGKADVVEEYKKIFK